MNKKHLLFLAILIEGYVVLAAELLAIRQLTPFVGSGVEVAAIIIGGVLMPLAFGYHYGGIAWRRAYKRARKRGKRTSIRSMLLRNLVIAELFLAIGLTYFLLEHFFADLNSYGITNRLWQTGIYTALFVVVPVFLLGQTVPLASNYFNRHRLSEITGKMLFFSTTGAFFGSIVSTLVLMMTIGVHNTVTITIGMLTLLCLMFCGRRRRIGGVAAVTIFLFCWLFNSPAFMRQLNIVSDNAYNIARIVTSAKDEDMRALLINRSVSSITSPDPEKQPEYVKYIVKTFLNHLPQTGKPHDILMIGAGGFSIGLKDTVNNYTIVDIDPTLKEIAENEFLKQKLSSNKHFVPASARAFLQQDKNTYDLIIVDVAQNTYAIPAETTTREFLVDVKAHLRENGAVAVNTIAHANFIDKFSARYARTFANVFPVYGRYVVGDTDPWQVPDANNPQRYLTNVVYSFINTPVTREDTVYTDDLNSFSIDLP